MSLPEEDFPAWFSLRVTIQGTGGGEEWFVEDEKDLLRFHDECLDMVRQQLKAAGSHGTFGFELVRWKSTEEE